MGLDETPERGLTSYWWLRPNPENAKVLRPTLRDYGVSLETTEAGIYLPPVGGQFTTAGPQLQTLQQHYNQPKTPEILQNLSQDLNLDYLLIDNQPEMSDDNLIGLSLADIAVVMMQLDTYDFQQVAVILDVIEQLTTAKIWLVPTLVLPKVEANSVICKIETAYQQPVAGVLHLSEEMIRLASSGLFCLHYPTHSLTQTMVAIAHQLEQDAQALPVRSGSSKNTSKLGKSRHHAFFNILEFPSVERRVLTAVLRQGPIALGMLIEHSGYSSDEVIMALDHLIEQGWLVQDPTTKIVRYYTEKPDR